MTDDELDFNLFGDVLTKPSTGETADPIDVLAGKVVSNPKALLPVVSWFHWVSKNSIV